VDRRVILILVVVRPAGGGAGWERLTEREKAVARLAAQAMTNQQIARRLGITTHTVNFHLRRIFAKLEIDSRVSLARLVDGPPAG
jgi:DNA-binding CsgD family transcriptional regulator